MKMVKAMPEHYEDYYYLRCDDNNVYWSGHKNSPSYNNLKNWYLNNIKRDDRFFFLAYEQQNSHSIIGYLYMDIIGSSKDIIDIGYGVHKNHSGKGYGTKLIAFANSHARNIPDRIHTIVAWVAQKNEPSIKVFLKNGYLKTGETKNVLFQSSGELMTFNKFVFKI
jgi:RimJ/RimL family protein N-acetyltransferase